MVCAGVKPPSTAMNRGMLIVLSCLVCGGVLFVLLCWYVGGMVLCLVSQSCLPLSVCVSPGVFGLVVGGCSGRCSY